MLTEIFLESNCSLGAQTGTIRDSFCSSMIHLLSQSALEVSKFTIRESDTPTVVGERTRFVSDSPLTVTHNHADIG